ncbi:hypothetical protein HDU96_008105 [Phlyctochytrium bullatum]|nr:hypothetical protein HDU96_008105 [Phlyctochytrium bullatum]
MSEQTPNTPAVAASNTATAPATTNNPPPSSAPAVDPETFQMGKIMEEAINAELDYIANNKPLLQALPPRVYLEQTVLPLLVDGMRVLVRERWVAPTPFSNGS